MDSFPHALEKLEGARRYISAFRAPLQELSPAQVHAMRACSLLVIPPPKEREPPPGGFPKDLSDLNLSSWAGLVQDVTSSLLAPPPNLGSEVSLPAVALLEKTTGWVYCHFCYHSPTKPPWGWEVCQFEGHSKEDCGGTLPRQTGPTDASATRVDDMRTPDSAISLTTTPGAASHALPASGTTAKEACGEGSLC